MFLLINSLILNTGQTVDVAEHRILFFLFIFFGAVSVVFSLVFSGIIKYSFFKGMSIAFCLFGMTELLLSFFSLQQMDEKRFLFLMAGGLSAFGGLWLFIQFYSSTLVFWKGLGLGLMIQGTIFTILCLMAAGLIPN